MTSTDDPRPSWVPDFYSKNSAGAYVMAAPNGCEYPLHYSDYPHAVHQNKTTDRCMACPKCKKCHVSHSGSHDGTGMMRLPDGRVVPNHLYSIIGAQGPVRAPSSSGLPGRSRR